MGTTAFLPKLVILMRHAEKSGLPGDSGLSPLGEDRALALAGAWPPRLGLPDVIVACRSTPRSTRPIDTVRPLADRLGLPIDERWGSRDCAALAACVATDPEYHDRRVLICWRHETLPLLAASFGVSAPSAWPADLYDAFWLIEKDNGTVRFRSESQQLPVDPLRPAKSQDGVQEDHR
jgi:hypothetical protein